MPQNHAKFHSANGRRLLLVADDEQINRELLGLYLQADYDIVFASDGAEALEAVRANKDSLSLVLLDILMPVMSGLDVLKALKADPETAQIPVIVITSEQSAEVESLKLGAIDFIPKPYPAADVVLARVLRTIELSEDREIIQSTERDALTGLYNKEYFYRYAQQFDLYHKDLVMDAMIVDVNHFHMLNERYGKAYGDEVLKRIGQQLLELVAETGAIACRKEADTFLIYIPHGQEYQPLMEKASVGLSDSGFMGNRVRLRMGVYENVDKALDIERRFDRAKMAADTVKGSFTRTLGVYDETLHKQELYAEQLIEDFQRAIDEKQFKVFYQPKFNVQADVPVLASAEALVRWEHPTLGMINPGIFISLFEENGLILKLDTYVWQEAARQIQDWRNRYGFVVPVSVNVSRVDMYDPNLTNTLEAIVKEHGLSFSDLMLEVTESAYTQDSRQIISTVEALRAMGFRIEMDDFGTGYSSLNMISTLPIDALKLDMEFIRSAFKPGGDTHMIEVIIDIAEYLAVPVIAEGVETEEQFSVLKAAGCDMIQGYFFSKPVPAAEFEPFILQRKEAEKNDQPDTCALSAKKDRQTSRQRREAKTPTADGGSDAGKEEANQSGMHLRTANIFFAVLAFIAAAALFLADISVTRGYHRMEQASDRYIAAQLAATNLESGSDYLTDRVRCFVVTGELQYLQDFQKEVEVTQRRDLAVQNLESLLQGSDNDALQSLSTALDLSNELVETEYYAMRLRIDAERYDPAEIPASIAATVLTPEDQALSKEEKILRAEALVFDSTYMHYKDKIRENVSLCTQALIRTSSVELETASARMSLLVRIQSCLTVIFLLIVIAIVVIIRQTVRKPLSKMVELMQSQEIIQPTGAEELRFVTRTYNAILEENKQAQEKLSHEASHDALTGLLNRGAYDMLMETVDTSHVALIMIDVDYFKSINDTYGHSVGDRVLKRVADILRHSFRSVDLIFRLGGDEFVVLMTRVNSSMQQLVKDKIARANHTLQHPKDDLPPVSLSVGVAFSDRENPQGDIYKDADTALYRVKEAGRNGCAIYE